MTIGYNKPMVILGIDEVGRGCWAGPLVAGAVVLERPLKGVRDSKQLSRQARERLVPLIQRRAIAYGLGWVEPAEVDRLGLTASVRLAYRRAMELISIEVDKIIIDGNYNFLADDPRSEAIIRADADIPSVSAASIIAKVARDAYMREQAKLYPAYGFERHVGYGTAVHRAALLKHGPCALHRLSFRPLRAAGGSADVTSIA
jgi:ribonuclease HII